jgi:hypothetical protein
MKWREEKWREMAGNFNLFTWQLNMHGNLSPGHIHNLLLKVYLIGNIFTSYK